MYIILISIHTFLYITYCIILITIVPILLCILHVILILVFLFFSLFVNPLCFVLCLATSLDLCLPTSSSSSSSSELQQIVSTKPFRVSSTRSMDSMPGTPNTFASYCDPPSPAPSSHHPHSRSNSVVARMDMEMGGVVGEEGGPISTKAHLMSRA